MTLSSEHDINMIAEDRRGHAIWPTPEIAALFSKHFSSSESQLLARRFKKTTFPAEEILWQEGSHVTGRMFLLSSGYVKLSSRRPEYRMPIVHAVIGPLSIFGEETLFLDEPSLYTVQCVSDIETLFMDRSAFDQLLYDQPRLANRFLQKLFSLSLHRQRATCKRMMAFF
nr:cyclic nucleotide-binding domain-containing protein [uncultured Desulfuromonas sp.]